MSLETKHFYEFGDFLLDLDENILRRDGRPLPITPKAFHLLKILVENHNHIVEKKKLLSEIWADSFVEEGNLTFNVRTLRKILNDDAQQPRFIETVPRRGYRFIASVKKFSAEALPESEEVEDFILNKVEAEKTAAPIIEENAGESFTVQNLPVENPHLRVFRSAAVSAIRTRPLFYLLAVIAVGIFLLTGFYLLKNSRTYAQKFSAPERGNRFLTIERLSDTGDTNAANISPDGKLLVYHSTDGAKDTIWLRRLATGNLAPLYSSKDERFYGLGFTPDGEYVTFSHSKKGEAEKLSRISILGGTPTPIIENFHGSTSFSPDGKQIAFVRFKGTDSVLMIADANGGANEREIYTSPRPRFITSIAWSPDGDQIAYCVGNGRYDGGGSDSSPFVFNLETKTDTSLTDSKWNYVKNIIWLPDQSGVLITAREKAEDTDQVWLISQSDRRAAQLTNDSNSLNLSGASEDMSRVIAVTQRINSSIWIAPSDNSASARQIAKAEFDADWTPDGKIIFPTLETIKSDIWKMNADGGERRQLTANDSLERYAVASSDGRFIIYVSNRNGQQNIWRMDAADGGNQMPLTNGDGESQPSVTPDGRSVVFIKIDDGSLWQVPIEGGTAMKLADEKTGRVAFSPDGTKIAYFGSQDGKRKLLVKSFPENALLNAFDASITNTLPRVVWAHDGKSLIYNIDNLSNIGNLWQQSLDGGAARQITNFTDNRIFDFSLSPDGKQFAFVRGTWSYDAVLLKN